VIDVHLSRRFQTSRASVELFREQQDGAYVLFTSTTGLIATLARPTTPPPSWV